MRFLVYSKGRRRICGFMISFLYGFDWDIDEKIERGSEE